MSSTDDEDRRSGFINSSRAARGLWRYRGVVVVVGSRLAVAFLHPGKVGVRDRFPERSGEHTSGRVGEIEREGVVHGGVSWRPQHRRVEREELLKKLPLMWWNEIRNRSMSLSPCFYVVYRCILR